ncbi:putative protein without homology [Propionibacterium freudenreichii subsp. shermanii]|nr:putative protein without homology [Propionibacterium freudenreichii subsp. shermanii]
MMPLLVIRWLQRSCGQALLCQALLGQTLLGQTTVGSNTCGIKHSWGRRQARAGPAH